MAHVFCVMTCENIPSMAHVRLMNILWKNQSVAFISFVFVYFLCMWGRHIGTTT